MSHRNRKNHSDGHLPEPGTKGKGMQGIDKAPGEEPANDTEHVSWEAQKGKNKVDGDPEKPEDQPIDQQ